MKNGIVNELITAMKERDPQRTKSCQFSGRHFVYG